MDTRKIEALAIIANLIDAWVEENRKSISHESAARLVNAAAIVRSVADPLVLELLEDGSVQII